MRWEGGHCTSELFGQPGIIGMMHQVVNPLNEFVWVGQFNARSIVTGIAEVTAAIVRDSGG